MGCNNVKLTALQELEYITTQIKKENTQLEKERDRLKIHHDNRPEEEKDSLQDLRIMHNDLEKEIKELKEIMIEFLPIPEQKDSSYLAVKHTIDKITNLQLDLEDKTEHLREKTVKRKSIHIEKDSLEKSIALLETQIFELEKTIQKYEWDLKEQGVDETNKSLTRQQSLAADDLRNLNRSFVGIQETSKESLNTYENDESSSEKENVSELLALSEIEINKELKDVQTELDALTNEITQLDLNEIERLHIGNYILSLNSQLQMILGNSNFKQQVLDSQARIERLKDEKRNLKQEIFEKKKSGKSREGDIGGRIALLDRILDEGRRSCFKENIRASGDTEELVDDVQETIRKAREVSAELKNKHFYRQGN